jgi:hypothetical protein
VAGLNAVEKVNNFDKTGVLAADITEQRSAVKYSKPAKKLA